MQLDERGRSEFRSAASKLFRMAGKVDLTGRERGAALDAPTAWLRLGELLKHREDRVHRLVLYPGPCLPDPKLIDDFHFDPKEMDESQKLIFAYSSWITSQLWKMETLDFLVLPTREWIQL